MKLYIYELQKLAGSRFVMGCICVLFLLNAALCSYMISDPYKLPEDAVREIYSLYRTDAPQVDAIYDEWQREFSVYEQQYLAFTKRGGIEPIPPRNYWLPDGMLDSQLYDKLYSDVARQAVLREKLADVVRSAMSSKLSLENSGSTDTFEYRYQLKIISRYTALHDSLVIGFEFSRGYNQYLGCRFPLFIAMLAAALVAGYFFTLERTHSSLALVRSSQRGRGRLTAAKIAAAFSVVLAFFVTMQLTALLTVGTEVGFSSPFNRIQLFDRFTFCPYSLSALECILVDFALKVCCLGFFTAIFLLAAARCDHLTSCAVNLSICAASIALYSFAGRTGGALFLSSPLMLAFDSLSRYYAYNLFGHPFGVIPVLPALLVILAAAATSFAGIVYARDIGRTFSVIKLLERINFRRSTREHVFSREFADKLTQKIAIHSKPSISLPRQELYKLFTNRAVLATLVLFAALSAYTIPAQLGSQSSDEEKLQDYIESSLYGVVTDEKLELVEAEGIRLADAVERYNANIDAYHQGKLPLEEFMPIADERLYADSRAAAYEKLRVYTEYLQSGEEGLWFVYETGWTRLFRDYNMIMIIIAVCFVSSVIVGVEYKASSSSGGFNQILRTTRNGRKATHKNKARILRTVIFILYTGQYTYRLLLIRAEFTLNGLAAPTGSLQMLGGSVWRTSLGVYLAAHYLYGLAFMLLVGGIAMELAHLTQSGLYAFVSVAAVGVIPELLEYLGVSIPQFLSIARLSNLANLRSASMLCAVGVLACAAAAIRVYTWRRYAQ